MRILIFGGMLTLAAVLLVACGDKDSDDSGDTGTVETTEETE